MKRILVFLMILCMLLSSVSAAADTPQARRLIDKLPTAAALLEEKVLKSHGQPPAFAKGTPVSKGLINFWPTQEINGKQKKVTSITLEQGDFEYYDFFYKFKGETAVQVTGTVKDPSVAELHQGGDIRFIRGIAPGVTRATFVEENSGKKCSLRIKVTPVKVKELAVASTRYEMKVGETLDLKDDVVLLPVDAANKNLTFKSNRKKIASVNKQGLVTAKKTGEAVITVQSKENKKLKEKITITVVEEPTSPVLPASDVTYRFFGVGQVDHNGYASDLPASEIDLNRMALAYGHASVNGADVRKSDIHTYKNLTGSQIIQVLDDMAHCGADANDVTVFYYSGHGVSSETNKEVRGALVGVDDADITVETVRQYLDKVPGNVVVILDSCLSGQFIQGKSAAAAKAAAQAAARNTIGVFASSTARNYQKALTDSPVSSKYKILVACQPLQNSGVFPEYSLFTYWAVQGLGVDYENASFAALKADADGNGVVSLSELHRYVEKNVAANRAELSYMDQVTMVWPANDRFPVLPRT